MSSAPLSSPFTLRPAGRGPRLWLAAMACGLLLASSHAHAKVAAAFGQAQGALTSTDSQEAAQSGLQAGIGVRLGVRLLIFEAYGEHTFFGTRGNLSRAIFGLRGGLSLGDWRLVGRAGAGLLFESGGVLAPSDQVGTKPGVAARLGVALERELVPAVALVGLGVEGERYRIQLHQTKDATGTDVFVNLYMLFELGL